MKRNIAILLASVVLIGACRKKDPEKPAAEPEQKGQVTLSFKNMADDEPLVLNTVQYRNEHGDTFTVSGYAYYISNISLSTASGSVYAEPESYHLVSTAEAGSLSFTIPDVTPGTYTSLKFLIGVDEARNTSGAQTGALSPTKGMYWDWTTGYIMAKLEGVSPSSAAPGNAIGFHLGGFSGPQSSLRWVTLPLAQPLIVTTSGRPVIHLKSNMLEWFRTPHTIDFSKYSIVMNVGTASTQIADNYSDMFSVESVEL